jgi:hypothetical protein
VIALFLTNSSVAIRVRDRMNCAATRSEVAMIRWSPRIETTRIETIGDEY